MDIKRVNRLDDVIGEAVIEIRDVGNGQFLLSATLSDRDLTSLMGPYPSAEVAEREGIEQAEFEGVAVLHIVHTKG